MSWERGMPCRKCSDSPVWLGSYFCRECMPGAGTGSQGRTKTERNAAIVEEFRLGQTKAAIARRHGLSQTRVAQIIKRDS